MKIPVLLLCVLTLALSIGCNVSATPEADSTKAKSSGSQDSTATGNTATPAAAKTLAEIVIDINSGDAVLIDVREQGEWDEKSFKMATLVPMSKINGQVLKELDLAGEKATKPTYTHCAKGFRAKKVADALSEDEVTVFALEYSFEELQEAGLELNKK